MKLLNMVKINNRVSMDAKKTIWVEYGLEPLDALPNQMGRLPQMQSNMIPRRLKPQISWTLTRMIFSPASTANLCKNWCRTVLGSGSLGPPSVPNSVREEVILDLAISRAVWNRSASNGLTSMSVATEANADSGVGSYVVTMVAGGAVTPKASQLSARLIAGVWTFKMTRSGANS
jgi:hypothetical protein